MTYNDDCVDYFWRCGHQHREGEKTERLKKVWQHEDKKWLSLETGITEFHSYKHYIYSHPLINIARTDKQTTTPAPSPSLSHLTHSLSYKIYLSPWQNIPVDTKYRYCTLFQIYLCCFVQTNTCTRRYDFSALGCTTGSGSQATQVWGGVQGRAHTRLYSGPLYN